ncbi:uncharacterized protein LOC134683704 [Mytilus trossulus]|uniref:uncharacterized protein LOC134683704 n=1 Tax=Mytilus trossulus TaxID=6551 RepID=UPI003007B85F
MKRTRFDYTAEMVEVLEVAWTAGMRSAGKDQKIVEVALQLQLQPEKVKEWIGNRNAKEARRQGGQTVKKSKILTKGPNAYSLFARSVERGSMDGKTYLQHVATEWRKKSNAAKETYAKQAEEIRADPFKGQDRQGVIAFNLKAIHAACDVLESVGFEIGGFGVDPTEEVNPVVFASRGALSFFSRKMQENFQTYVTGKTQVGSRELEKKDLEQLVRKQVNSAWAKTSTSTKCPYKDVKDGKVDVEIKGLLDNISLKDPSWYGIKTLKTMLDSNIEFKIRQNQQNQTIDEGSVTI